MKTWASLPPCGPCVASCVAVAAVALACSGERNTATGGAVHGEVPAAVIDTDATLEDVEPGRGVGLFVEYASGGRWRVQVTCDTLESDFGCSWDVLISSPEPLTEITPQGLPLAALVGPAEAQRSGRSQGAALRFVSETTTDVEGVRFEATPGAPVRIDVMLDGVADGRYVYWVGGGALHRGAPAPVLDLLPTAP